MALQNPDTWPSRVELERALADRASADRLFGESLFKYLTRQEQPCIVTYADRRHTYTTPKEFCWTVNRSPSDCVWAVPGTWQ